MIMITFSRGAWISVIVPKFIDPCWSKKDLQFYATIYAAALEKYGDKIACVIAEIAVNKRLYTDIKYELSLENKLQSLYD